MNKYRKEWEEKNPVCPECGGKPPKSKLIFPTGWWPLRCSCVNTGIQQYTQYLESELEKLNNRLTPSDETKAEYSEKFCFSELRTEYDENGDMFDYYEKIFVPWETIKEIMKAIKGNNQ